MANLNQLPQRGEADKLGRLAEKAGRLKVAGMVRMFLASLMADSEREQSIGKVEGRSPTAEEKIIWEFVQGIIARNGATPDEDY